MASQIISKIKQARRNLAIFSTPIQSILPPDSKADAIKAKTDEEIIDDTQVLLDIRAPFTRSYKSLLKQHELVQPLLSTSNADQKELQEFISANKEYTNELSQASDLLLKLDSTVEQLMAEGRSRDLPMAEFNDDLSSTTTGKSAATHPPRPAIRKVHAITEVQESTTASPNTESQLNHNEPAAQKVIYVNQDSTNAFVTASLIGNTLPEFSGDILKFPEFMESFDCLIRHGHITGSDKLALLRMCLKNEALEIISGFSRIDSNYQHAIALLKKEYDRPHLRHHALLSKLRNLPQCEHEGPQLRSLYLQLNIIIRQLMPNGVMDTPDLLINLVTSKLPISLQTSIIKQSARKTNFGIYDVLSTIADSVENLKIQHEIMTSKTSELSIIDESDSHEIQDSSATPYPSINRYTNHSPRSCRLCDGSHFEQHCTQYTTPRDRSIAVKQRNLCNNCLSHGHIATECRNTKRCHSCNGLHHTSICIGPTKQ